MSRIPFIDLCRASLFRRSIPELATLSQAHRNVGYEGVKTLEELSAKNLALIRTDCETHIPETERERFRTRFAALRFYWKHGTGVLRLLQKYERMVSATYLVEREHGPAVIVKKTIEGKFYYAYVPVPEAELDQAKDAAGQARLVKFLSTSKLELDYRGDGGFIFFRYNIGSGHMPDTRFGEDGGAQIILDPVQDARLHQDGWVTLRDVFLPYSNRDLSDGRLGITSGGSQRITCYDILGAGDIPVGVAPNAPLTVEELDDVVDVLYGEDLDFVPGYKSRRIFHHTFRNGRPNRAFRSEHVLEGAFHGPHLEEGVLLSAMRAFWEIPPLWATVTAEALDQDGFRDLMRAWLHRFFHIEAKYPWAISLPGLDGVEEPMGTGPEDAPLPAFFGETGARLYFIYPDPSNASDTDGDSVGSAISLSSASDDAATDYADEPATLAPLGAPL
ncbi:MAG: hypothetical protein AAFW69_07205 [Pseudomonadota bacterium]